MHILQLFYYTYIDKYIKLNTLKFFRINTKRVTKINFKCRASKALKAKPCVEVPSLYNKTLIALESL